MIPRLDRISRKLLAGSGKPSVSVIAMLRQYPHRYGSDKVPRRGGFASGGPGAHRFRRLRTYFLSESLFRTPDSNGRHVPDVCVFRGSKPILLQVNRRASHWERQKAIEIARQVLQGQITTLEAVRELVPLAHTDGHSERDRPQADHWH